MYKNDVRHIFQNCCVHLYAAKTGEILTKAVSGKTQMPTLVFTGGTIIEIIIHCSYHLSSHWLKAYC